MPHPSKTPTRKAGSKGRGSQIDGLRRSDCGDIPPRQLENVETGETWECPDYPAIAERYARMVADEEFPTNRLLVLAAQRYLRMKAMAADPGNEFIYSAEHVIDYCSFGEKLRHFEGGNWQINQLDENGEPDSRIILEPFEIWIESAIHGFRLKHPNGSTTRLVKTALELIPRKNAKSLRATRAALFELCCSGQKGAEIPIAAFSSKQADDTLYGDIVSMLNADEELREEYGIRVTKDEVTCNGGTIFKLTMQADRLDGLNPSLALFEEGHAGADAVYKVVDSAFGARPNALRRMITTAGQRPEGPAYELLAQARLVLEGGIEDYTFFAAIYTLDAEDYMDAETKAIDWQRLLTDESLIARCNPMYGVGLDKAIIRNAVNEAYKRRIDKRGEVARTRFNLWTNAGSNLIEPEAWAACKRNISEEDFLGQKCWIGVDLAQVLDMCAVILVFHLATGELAVFCRFYLPEASPTRLNPEIADHIDNWADQGFLTLTEGALADHDRVRADIELFAELFDVQVIACDPHQAHNTAKHLWDGNLPVRVYPNRADTMTPPLDDILGRIVAQTIWHDGNPVLAWMAQNVQGERRGNGTIMPRKDREDSPRKIDGIVALCFADGCIMEPEFAKDTGPETPKATVQPRVVGFEEIVGA